MSVSSLDLELPMKEVMLTNSSPWVLCAMCPLIISPAATSCKQRRMLTDHHTAIKDDGFIPLEISSCVELCPLASDIPEHQVRHTYLQGKKHFVW